MMRKIKIKGQKANIDPQKQISTYTRLYSGLWSESTLELHFFAIRAASVWGFDSTSFRLKHIFKTFWKIAAAQMESICEHQI